MKKLNLDNLKFNDPMDAAYKIVEIAIRHGFDVNLKDYFYDYVEDCIKNYWDYISSEEPIEEITHEILH